jgi:SAM-dependent methyltransferase
VTGRTRDAIFRRMLDHPRYLYRPWIPILKCLEGEVFGQLPLQSPVLDLACGDGIFSWATFGRTLEVGVDLDARSLAEAARLRMHQALVRADAAALPFRAGHFRSIISVCAIEHMDAIAAVLRELSRVLAPGGMLYATVPSEQFGDLLLASRLWRAVGFPRRADAYGARKNARSHHVNVWSAKAWSEALARESLTVVEASYLLSPRVMTLWSLCTSTPFELAFLPFRLGRDRQWPWMNRTLRSVLLAGILPVLAQAPGPDPARGGYLFLAARKADG